MELIPPIKNFNYIENISQMFGCNPYIYQKKYGIPAHNGIDIVVKDNKNGYGTPVIATHNGTVEKMIFDNLPLHTKGNGIYILDDSKLFSTVYWHLSAFECSIGQKVSKGQVIGLMGNSGYVLPQPTPNQPYNGTHLHFAVNNIKTNEYNGFIDPIPLLYKKGDKLPIYIFRDLFKNIFGGSRGNDVSYLQTCLKIEGLADYEPIGIFGNKTKESVKKLQERYDIQPTKGYCGVKTRQFISNKYLTGQTSL